MTQTATGNLSPQKVAELYQQSRKQNSQTHTQSTTASDNRKDFQLWFQGLQSCLQLLSQQGTQGSSNIPSPGSVSMDEIYTIVEKQHKAA
jgi:hypothetical protein